MKNNLSLPRKPGCCGHFLTSADNNGPRKRLIRPKFTTLHTKLYVGLLGFIKIALLNQNIFKEGRGGGKTGGLLI